MYSASPENLTPSRPLSSYMQATSLGQDEELHWLALRMIPGLGTRNAGKLIERFRTPQAVLRASRTELEAAGVSGSVAQSIASGCAFVDAVAPPERKVETGAGSIPITDAPCP